MNPIATIADLFRAGAHWIAEGLMRIGRGVSAFYARLSERFGTLLVAPRETIVQFWNTVRQSVNVARSWATGQNPPIGDIPLIPGELSSRRFRVQGIVSIRPPRALVAERPNRVDVPFTRDGDDIYSKAQMEDALQDEIREIYRRLLTESPEAAAKLREAYPDFDLEEPVEYDISGLFVWRTY